MKVLPWLDGSSTAAPGPRAQGFRSAYAPEITTANASRSLPWEDTRHRGT